jgi:hypothetical protein
MREVLFVAPTPLLAATQAHANLILHGGFETGEQSGGLRSDTSANRTGRLARRIPDWRFPGLHCPGGSGSISPTPRHQPRTLHVPSTHPGGCSLG